MAVGTKYLKTVSGGIKNFLGNYGNWDSSIASPKALSILNEIDKDIERIIKLIDITNVIVPKIVEFSSIKNDFNANRSLMEICRSELYVLQNSTGEINQARYEEVKEDYNYYSTIVQEKQGQLSSLSEEILGNYSQILGIGILSIPGNIISQFIRNRNNIGKIDVDYSTLNTALADLVNTVNGAVDDTNLQSLVSVPTMPELPISINFIATIIKNNISKAMSELVSIVNNISNYQGHIAEAEGQTSNMGTIGSIMEWNEPVLDFSSSNSAYQTDFIENENNDEAEQNAMYVVKKGDTLAKIAQKYYGNSSKAFYMKIAEANGISNPNLINVGMSLVIPSIQKEETSVQPQGGIVANENPEIDATGNDTRVEEEPVINIPTTNEEALERSLKYSTTPYSGTGFEVTTGNKTYELTDEQMKVFCAVVASEAAKNKDDALGVASVALNVYEKEGRGPDLFKHVITNKNVFAAYEGSNYQKFMNGTYVIPDYVIDAVNDAVKYGIRNTEYTGFGANFLKDGSTHYSENLLSPDGNRYFMW